MVGFNIRFPQADIDSMKRLLERAQTELGKSATDAVNWAGYFVTRSIAASTRVSAKLRQIVKNPDPRAGKDGRVAIYGVWKYHPVTGEKKFSPILKGGEYGAQIKYVSKKNVLLKLSAGVWEKWEAGTDEFQVPGLTQHPKRKIWRSGLAKKSWRWAQKNIRKGGTASINGAKNAISVSRTGGKSMPTLTITNRLRYMGYALANGRQDVNAAMARAASAMRDRINKALAKVRK